MTLLPPRSPEKRPPPFCFRCPKALRERIQDRAKTTGYAAGKVGETVMDWGLTMWDALESAWNRIDLVARENEESFPAACRRLIDLGLDAYEKTRRGGKR